MRGAAVVPLRVRPRGDDRRRLLARDARRRVRGLGRRYPRAPRRHRGERRLPTPLGGDGLNMTRRRNLSHSPRPRRDLSHSPRPRRNLRFTRRHLLSAMGVSAAVAPFVPLLESAAGGPEAAPKRLVLVFSPHGTIKDNWRPIGSETNFALSPILQPLQPYKDR